MKSVYFLLTFTVILFAIGILMVFDTTSAEVIDRSLDVSTRHALVKQLIYGCFGLCLALVTFYFGYHKVLQSAPWIFYGLTACLILVFVPGIGRALNGAHRWIFSRTSFFPAL